MAINDLYILVLHFHTHGATHPPQPITTATAQLPSFLCISSLSFSLVGGIKELYAMLLVNSIYKGNL